MKKRFVLTGALVLLLVLVGSAMLVSADQPAARSAAQATGTLEGPRWILVSYADASGKTVQAQADVEAWAQFEKGRVVGSTGCNRFSAPYETDGNKLTIGMTATTMMACPPPVMDQESAFTANLLEARSYKIAGDELTIANSKGQTLLTFKAETPLSLTDGVWVLTMVNNGKGAVTGVLPDVEVTAAFGKDGRVSGSGGCNTYSAAYKANGNKIEIGLPISTMMACEQPIMDQEQQYLAAIHRAATFKIEGSKLELRDAGGALLASYAQQAAAASALVGPVWEMTGVNNGREAVVSALPDVAVTAIFGEDGTVSGSAGCNTYSAPYKTDGDKIEIGLGISTMMMCTDPIMEQEQWYLKALTAAATYQIDGSKLVLRDAKGAMQVTYAKHMDEAAQPATAPAVQPTAAPSVAKPAAAATTAKLAQGNPGLYLTIRPAADGGAATIALNLNADGKAEFATSFEKQTPVVQTGLWEESADGGITVTLTDSGGQKMAQPMVMKFARDGTFLNAVEYDKQVYGEQGLKLNLAADIARKVGSALVTLDLAAGFPLDPTFVSVNGGGEVDASLLGQGCQGFINRNPVVTVNWTGKADFVRAFFYSDADSTLVVLGPDGKLTCNNDANEQLLDPVLEIKNPAPGKYRIWVGSTARRQLIPGVLVLTSKPGVNLDTFAPGDLIKRPKLPLVSAKPVSQTAAETVKKELEAALKASELQPGVPLTSQVVANGETPLFQFPVTKTCAGMVGDKPSATFLVSGKPEQVNVLFEGDGDATLLVIGDGGKVVECNDDSAAGNTNPMITLKNPPAGGYLVFVGRTSPEKPVKGTLTITDAADAVPAVLAPAKK